MAETRTPRMGILEDMTIEEVRAFKAEIVVIPIGSTEPHGPHLPYCTDTVKCRAVAEDAVLLANSRGVRALCYPALPIGLNVNFTAFPFALSLRVPTFMAMLHDLCEHIEREGVRRILLVNGHGGNTAAIDAFLRDWAHRGVPGTPGAENRSFVCSVLRRTPRAGEVVQHPSDHAGEAETMEMMGVCPELVRMDKLADFKWGRPAVEMLSDPRVSWVRPWHLHVPASAGGETRTATMDRAQQLCRMNVEWVAGLICDLCKTPWSERYPYA